MSMPGQLERTSLVASVAADGGSRCSSSGRAGLGTAEEEREEGETLPEKPPFAR